MKRYYIIGKKWHDKINGNTYFNAKVIDEDTNTILYTGYQYGYGDAYRYEATKQLEKLIDPARYDKDNYKIYDLGVTYDKQKVLKNNLF